MVFYEILEPNKQDKDNDPIQLSIQSWKPCEQNKLIAEFTWRRLIIAAELLHVPSIKIKFRALSSFVCFKEKTNSLPTCTILQATTRIVFPIN